MTVVHVAAVGVVLVAVVGWGVRCWWRDLVDAASDLPPLDPDQLARTRRMYLVGGPSDA